MAIAADVTDPGQVEAMFQKIDEAWGGIDILVDNVGIHAALDWDGEGDGWDGRADWRAGS